MSLTYFTPRAFVYVEKKTFVDEVFNLYCVQDIVADDFISALADLSLIVNMSISCGWNSDVIPTDAFIETARERKREKRKR